MKAHFELVSFVKGISFRGRGARAVAVQTLGLTHTQGLRQFQP